MACWHFYRCIWDLHGAWHWQEQFMSLSKSIWANEVSGRTVVGIRVLEPSVCYQPWAAWSSTGCVVSRSLFQTANWRWAWATFPANASGVEDREQSVGALALLLPTLFWFLTNITHYVRILGGISKDSPVLSGVPQCTVLGPLPILNNNIRHQ